MNIFTSPRSLIAAAVATLAMTGASADIIDFKDMADNGPQGESIWDTLTVAGTGFSLAVTGTKNGSAAYAYLDSGNAGLGVCGVPNSTGVANLNTNRGTSSQNLCNPGSDDNVTVGESLSFMFDVAVVINNIWLNNNHDADKSLFNDTVNINGSGHTFTTDLGGPADYAVNNSYNLAANTAFTIAFFGPDEVSGGDQFYVSKIDVSAAVPEPVPLALLGLGLLGLTLRRRTV